MKIAVVGSRHIKVNNLSDYLPLNTSAIISGGAKGVDTCAKKYAEEHEIPLVEIYPLYERYGRAAPLVRNREIVLAADRVLAFWDGRSKGTRHVIELCRKLNKPITVYMLSPAE